MSEVKIRRINNLMKRKKSELVNIIVEHGKTRDEISKEEKGKWLGKIEGLKSEVFRLQKFISKYRTISDKFNLQKGCRVYIEYESKVRGLRTSSGLFEEETQNHIVIRAMDGKSSYRYYIKKKLINGMKEYYQFKK